MNQDAFKVAGIALVAAAIGFYLGTQYARPAVWTLDQHSGTLFNSSTGEVYKSEMTGGGRWAYLRQPLLKYPPLPSQ